MRRDRSSTRAVRASVRSSPHAGHGDVEMAVKHDGHRVVSTNVPGCDGHATPARAPP
ncbi:hypothetical protein [Microbacterium sp.]|uniref:hypothetical protein n=1 Tax=Microbacterium sp. TaxID=51671 RepID=UPI003919FA3B